LHINTRRHQPPQQEANATRVLDARNHYPQIKHHTPPPKCEATTRTPNPETKPSGPKAGNHTPNEAGAAGLLSQSPIVCLAIPSPQSIPLRLNICRAPSRRHYSDSTPHGSHPTNWDVSRGAP